MTKRTIDVPLDVFNNLDDTIEDVRYRVLQLNSTKPSILVHINDFLPSSENEKTTFTWSKDFENFSVNVKYNHNSNFSKKQLLQSISKILLDLSNEDDELLFKKVAKFNDRPLLKDLLKEFSYPCENITFRYDAKFYTEHIIIGKNYENCLVCDWNLLSEEPQENIFKCELFEGGWCQTSDILNVKVEMMSFLDDDGKPKEPKYIAEELWNKLLEKNS